MPFRNFDAAEKILTERQRMERPLMVLIWLAITSYALSLGHVAYVFAGTLAASLNLLATMRAKEVYVHRLIVNIGVLLATVVLVVELFHARDDQLVALGHYLCLILICKLFERKNNRDYVQMFFLSLLLMVAASLNTSAMWFGAAVVGFIALMCYTGMVFTLKRGLDKAASVVLAGESAPPEVDRVAWHAKRFWPAGALRRKLLLMLLVVGWFVVLSFLFLPRLSIGPGGGGPGGASFASTLHLGQPRQVYLSQEVLLVASYEGDWSGVEHWGYLRGQVMDRYSRLKDGSSWSRSGSSDGRPAWPGPRRGMTFDAPRAVPETSVVVQAKTSLGPTIFGVFPTVAVDLAPLAGADDWLTETFFGLAPGRPDPRTQPQADRRLCWTLPEGRDVRGHDRTWVAYRSYTALPAMAQTASWPTWERRGERVPLLREPESTRPRGDDIDVPLRVKELAKTWCQDLLEQRRRGDQPFDAFDLPIAERIAQRLREEYSYTLDLRDADPRRDAVEDFLFHLQRGHCEYFASAMTVMCQSLDVRARLATGFRVDGANRLDDGRYAARGLDAHAWTEVYSEPGGWRVIDATSASPYRPAEAGWLAGLWSGMRTFWEDRVVGYDGAQQRSLAQWLRSGFQASHDAAREWLGGVGRGLWQFFLTREVDRDARVFLAVLLAVSVVLEGVLVWRWLRRRRSGRTAAMSLAMFAPLAKLLRRHAPPRAKHQTLRDQAAAAVAAGWPEDKLLPLLALYQRIRWGGYLPPREERDTARRQMNELKTHMKTR